jgi:hypothetical protein
MKIGDLTLSVAGLGIILYSPDMAPKISPRTDYLSESFLTPLQVAHHAQQGSLAAFGTGSPGTYIVVIELLTVAPSAPQKGYSAISGLRVTDKRLCVRDLYDLMDWDSSCPEGQEFFCPNGLYEVHIESSLPESGLFGDDQHISISLVPVANLPLLSTLQIPKVCD